MVIAFGALMGGVAMMLGNSVWESTLQRNVPAESLSASGYWKRTLTDEGWRDAKADWNAQVESETAG